MGMRIDPNVFGDAFVADQSLGSRGLALGGGAAIDLRFG